jgi:hypothetical protein
MNGVYSLSNQLRLNQKQTCANFNLANSMINPHFKLPANETRKRPTFQAVAQSP